MTCGRRWRKREELGPLRISVDAHGGPATGGRLVGKSGEPLDLAGFRTTIEYYLTGVFNVMRLAAAAIARQEPVDGQRGVIVNTASIAAYEGQIGQLPYAAAKGGVVEHDAGRGPRPVPARHPGRHDRPGHLPDSRLRQGGRPARGLLGPADPAPQADGPARRSTRPWSSSICENDYLNGEVIRLDGALRFPPK